MIYFLTWLIVALITVCTVGYFSRGHDLKKDDYGTVIFMSFAWPLVVVLGSLFAVIMIPFGLFAFFRGDLDEPIKKGIKWIKTTWNSIGD